MNPRILRAAPAIWTKYTTRTPRACVVAKWLQSRGLSNQASHPPDAVPLRKHLKDEAKRKRANSKTDGVGKEDNDPLLDEWELTVGIEIHAELNTARKLFSSAPAAPAESNGQSVLPNTQVALFDAAMPGSQPQFQTATLLPALRAAIALDCEVQRKSGWDRKHYFHWDQPNGYQITQYYQPFAMNGHVTLTTEDGVPETDLHGAESLRICIKQIQMEQDTAKTTNPLPGTYHVDLNRAGHPLIEIITLPQIHSPKTASAVVRKIQAMLRSVDACVTGMELGGLRADVNVSVRERGTSGIGSSYSGVLGLGQRTEIKNLSSFTAIESAIIAERDRQISVLEAGGHIEGETRGWTLGATETTRLRGKEGEVDYRYMPDADLAPLIIGADLVDNLRSTLPELPDATVQRLQNRYGVNAKDARTLVALDEGERVDFLEDTVHIVTTNLAEGDGKDEATLGKMAANWILHELGGLLATSNKEWNEMLVTSAELADILTYLVERQITSRSAKQLLFTLFSLGPEERRLALNTLIDEGNLRLRPLSHDEYLELAQEIMSENSAMVAAVREKGQKGKVMWFVGQMIRRGEEGTVEPEKAKEIVEQLLQ